MAHTTSSTQAIVVIIFIIVIIVVDVSSPCTTHVTQRSAAQGSLEGQGPR